MSQLTQEYLMSALNYDPEIGVLRWRHRPDMKPAWNGRYAGHVAGSVNCDGYCHIQINGKTFKSHRLAFLWMIGAFPPNVVDHINGDKRDNRWGNLRAASNSENLTNRGTPINNTSGFKGACFRDGKWEAVLMKNRKQFRKTGFLTAAEAHEGYVQLVAEHHGEFGRPE